MELHGQPLSLSQIAAVALGSEPVRVSPTAHPRIQASRAVIDRIVADHTLAYGITTGFGKLADVRIPRSDLRDLQLNLVRSHACGIGPLLSVPEVRAMMLLRANVLALGFSGIRLPTIELLCEMITRGVTPVIPEKGSVGASGDLAPLAHLSLSLIGEGEAFVEGKRMPSAEALRGVGLEPVELAAKEGLALLNGTQGMHGVGGLA
jgi:histidine ammonia-lyase